MMPPPSLLLLMLMTMMMLMMIMMSMSTSMSMMMMTCAISFFKCSCPVLLKLQSRVSCVGTHRVSFSNSLLSELESTRRPQEDQIRCSKI